MSKSKSHSRDVLPLVKLVRRHVDSSGLTLRDFAAARGITYGTLRRYYDAELEPLRSPPRVATQEQLAAALRVPVEEVAAAVAASTVSGKRLGLVAAPSTFPRPWDDLDPAGQKIVLDLFDGLRQQRKGSRG